jgi:hypothetical protein
MGRVGISRYELWKIDDDGLIAESKGHFDAADYERQLQHESMASCSWLVTRYSIP